MKVRIAAVVGVLLLAAGGGLLRSAGPAAAVSPSAAASAYLVGQLANGDHVADSYGIEYGLTADLAIALASSNDQDTALARAVGYLAAHVADYADPAGTGQFPGPFGGATGKLALLAEITGQDPHDFGGFDLLQTLTDHVCSAPDVAGYCSAAGDFYGAFSGTGQALAVLALARAGIAPPAATVTRLGQLQCPDGGFSSALQIDASHPCVSEVDTTGYAVQALSLVAGTATEVGNARDYLLAGQQPDGGFLGAAGENANSTGLAVQGLLVTGTGSQPQVDAAVSYLLGLQNADGGFGISHSTPASDVRSTAQALPAIAGATLTTVSDPVTPIAPSTPAPTPTPTATRTSGHPSPSATPVSTSASAGSAVGGVGSQVSPSGELAATGSRTRVPLLAGILLILAGGAALRVGRRPQPGRPPQPGRRSQASRRSRAGRRR